MCCRAHWKLWATCTRLPFEEDGTASVDNLYARLGDAAPNFCFAGHTDVVPVGAQDDWQVDPFPAHKKTGFYGARRGRHERAIAAFVSAVSAHLEGGRNVNGSISLLITGDEEGPSINGTRKMLDWLGSNGEVIDDCVVGEPTNPDQLGDMIKIGGAAASTASLR